MSAKTSLRRLLLALSLLLCCASFGCHQPQGSNGEVATPTKPATLILYIDHSESTKDYQNGSLDGFRIDCMKVAQAYIKPLLSQRDSTDVEIHDFAHDDQVVLRLKITKWEDLRKKLHDELWKEPYPATEQSKTLFSEQINSIHVRAKQIKGDLYVLTLSDGHPDEEYSAEKAVFPAIKAAADAFAADDPGNLANFTIASVEPDMKNQWRERLEASLAPLKTVSVVNHLDYSASITDNKTLLVGGTK
jgi:hypothetical protein